jgi:hypothetical protein
MSPVHLLSYTHIYNIQCMEKHHESRTCDMSAVNQAQQHNLHPVESMGKGIAKEMGRSLNFSLFCG